MAKVLACPACGYKHPLDLLVGLDSFVCKECGKKLAVPSEALPSLAKPVARASAPAPDITSTPGAITPEANAVDENEDVMIVARASMSASSAVASEKISDKAADKKIVAASEAVPATTGTHVSTQSASTAEEPQAGLPKSSPAKEPHAHVPKMPSISIPFIGRIFAWLVSIPVGFVVVVLLPRFFGYGFHASSFVDVITTQGLGRYKIVVALVALWSIATVSCVAIFNMLVRRLLRARKLAA